MSDGASLESLKQLYFTLDLNYSKLYQACTTTEERAALRDSYVKARDNFLKARNKIFQDNDAQVQSLVAELQTKRAEILKSIEEQQNIAQILGIIAKAADAGAGLLALAHLP
jgi:CTP:phosphocholine cytidylyltransferase-like protein